MASAQAPVQVTVEERSRTVAAEAVTRTGTGGYVYRLVVPPGAYVVYSGPIRAPQVAAAAALHPGETDHVNLVPDCQ